LTSRTDGPEVREGEREGITPVQKGQWHFVHERRDRTPGQMPSRRTYMTHRVGRSINRAGRRCMDTPALSGFFIPHSDRRPLKSFPRRDSSYRVALALFFSAPNHRSFSNKVLRAWSFRTRSLGIRSSTQSPRFGHSPPCVACKLATGNPNTKKDPFSGGSFYAGNHPRTCLSEKQVFIKPALLGTT
jgi:hypothetical protein